MYPHCFNHQAYNNKQNGKFSLLVYLSKFFILYFFSNLQNFNLNKSQTQYRNNLILFPSHNHFFLHGNWCKEHYFKNCTATNWIWTINIGKIWHQTPAFFWWNPVSFPVCNKWGISCLTSLEKVFMIFHPSYSFH